MGTSFLCWWNIYDIINMLLDILFFKIFNYLYMKSDEILILLKEVFEEHDIVESNYKKFNLTFDRFYIKRYIPKFKSKLSIGEVKQLLIGTTLIEDTWEVILSTVNQSFVFKIERGFERQSLEIIKDWYDEYKKIDDSRNLLMSKYSRIRKNFKEELREHQLNKLL